MVLADNQIYIYMAMSEWGYGQIALQWYKYNINY